MPDAVYIRVLLLEHIAGMLLIQVRSLAMSQLILAMQRIDNGGVLIMLLHKVDSWASASIL